MIMNMHRFNPVACCALLLAGPCATVAAEPAAPAAAQLPLFRAGLWSYSIDLKAPGSKMPHVQKVEHCADPTADINGKWQALSLDTCKFSPLQRDGNAYSYTSSCKKGTQTVEMKSTILVESAEAYQVNSESTIGGGQVRREVITAKRTGDCQKTQATANRLLQSATLPQAPTTPAKAAPKTK
jgi:hypothetical protein